MVEIKATYLMAPLAVCESEACPANLSPRFWIHILNCCVEEFGRGAVIFCNHCHEWLMQQDTLTCSYCDSVAPPEDCYSEIIPFTMITGSALKYLSDLNKPDGSVA